MILHLWTEASGLVRVRITRTTDVTTNETTTSYAATKADVIAEVEKWLDSLVTSL